MDRYKDLGNIRRAGGEYSGYGSIYTVGRKRGWNFMNCLKKYLVNAKISTCLDHTYIANSHVKDSHACKEPYFADNTFDIP